MGGPLLAAENTATAAERVINMITNCLKKFFIELNQALFIF